jgi:putative hydrolase of the HAD superfamily
MIEDAEAVFFDIGGVLLDLASVREGHRRFVAELATQYGLDIERALEVWREVLGDYFRERRGTEFRSAAEGYRRAIVAAVGTEVPEREWRPLFERATDETLRPIDGAGEVLDALSGEVYLGVISDIDTAEAERILGGFGMIESFETVITSEAVGRTKPDPAVFAAAIGRAGVDPNKSAIIGDRYHNDMRGGSWAGLRTIAFGGSAANGPGGDRDGFGDDGDDGDDGNDRNDPVIGDGIDGENGHDPDDVVDYRVSDLRDVPAIVGLEEPS